jgi:hypothetical protein
MFDALKDDKKLSNKQHTAAQQAAVMPQST